MVTYKIKYRDAASRGEWRDTLYVTSKTTPRKAIAAFFGLDRPDVYEYAIEPVDGNGDQKPHDDETQK